MQQLRAPAGTPGSDASPARQRIEDLEELLRGDLADKDEMRDSGWDPESLRQEYGGADSDDQSKT